MRERYEIHHGVKLKDSALVAAAVLSNRYIADRFLPDKAIDLVDEAAARLRMEIDSMPVELDEIERRVMQLEIEREALRKEKDKASRERLDKLDRELADLKENRGRLKAQWEQEKDAIQQTRKLKEELEAAAPRDRAGAARRRLREGVGAAVRPAATARKGDPGAAKRTSPRARGCSRKKWTKKTSPRSSADGRTSRSAS